MRFLSRSIFGLIDVAAVILIIKLWGVESAIVFVAFKLGVLYAIAGESKIEK